MPEIGEVARVVHYLRKHAVGKRITSVQVQEDNIIYGKANTTASAFQKAMTGKTVLDARQQGKYFWLVMDTPPHPVMHLGMTGWIRFSNDDSSHYGKKKTASAEEPEPWPPRFWKFVLKMQDEHEIAFVDARRLARIRLVDVPGDALRNTTPLKENGPDPVIDKDILTIEWLSGKLRSKRVPIKALLLDQANISGVGNWVADEVLYQARIHPEQYTNSFSDEQIATLHKALMHVCDTAVNTLADSDAFPESWLMKYRWDKGKKDSNTLPNGDKIVHLKVGGRTSAIVPRVQKKTGAVAADVEDQASSGADEQDDTKPKPKARKRKVDDQESSPPKQKRGRKPKKEETSDVEDTEPAKKQSKKQKNEQDVDVEEEDGEEDVKLKAKEGRKSKMEKEESSTGNRRSGRLSGKMS